MDLTALHGTDVGLQISYYFILIRILKFSAEDITTPLELLSPRRSTFINDVLGNMPVPAVDNQWKFWLG